MHSIYHEHCHAQSMCVHCALTLAEGWCAAPIFKNDRGESAITSIALPLQQRDLQGK